MTLEFIQLGRLASSHGLEGNLVLNHKLGKNKELKKLKHVFVELKRESYIPYFIDEISFANDNELFIHFEDVNTIEAAKKLSGKNVYLSTDQYDALKVKNDEINFVGFDIYDVKLGLIGKIIDLIETPGQVLATVHYQDVEVLIPIISQTIKDININSKKLILTIPDGLLDVYLNN